MSDMVWGRVVAVSADGASARLSPEPDDVSPFLTVVGGPAVVGAKCVILQANGGSVLVPSVEFGVVSGGGGSGGPGPSGPRGPAGHTGASGPPGHVGAKGDPGHAGHDGAAGTQGIRGPAGTGVTIKGSATTAVIRAKTGTAGDMWISTDNGHGLVSNGQPGGWTDVGSIRGPEGPQGLQGVKGAAGPTGHVGATGPAGHVGAAGAAGHAGHAGVQGVQGVRGPRGLGIRVEGVVDTRSHLDHLTGMAVGDVHFVKDTGDLFIFGETPSGGTDTSWHDLGHVQGPVGARGIQGVQGAPGVAGHDGLQGAPGADGSDGSAGADGHSIHVYVQTAQPPAMVAGDIWIDGTP